MDAFCFEVQVHEVHPSMIKVIQIVGLIMIIIENIIFVAKFLQNDRSVQDNLINIKFTAFKKN